MLELLTIGAAAKASGLTAKMIRHYEQLGLLRKMPRTESGYRLYNSEHIDQLRFIRQARNLGFSLSDIQSLLELWHDSQRESRAVKQIAEQHLSEIKAKISELKHMQQILSDLADNCRGDGSPDCNILKQLAKPD
ncbi:Cu(I)-responsive transcriptional regulator [Neptunicella marina]|uniref:Cu(I)-responsive transcriptional regulator n=1 Tax=Neptunicella marina TaxID=2125989 RepID=A0A8J6IV15_9ALTE|nr:Cu(I)-responsive transcriptional regulator [Neptunicella marina]MBC3766158.1 Cu(I)-responsive transcriptional regulator [Neptunicella marina]